MLQALLSGVASIKAHQTRMNVIGNNLANVNTTAYKGSRVGFQDMLSQTVQGASSPTTNQGGRNSIQYGLGVVVGATDVNGEQGSLGATNRPTDLAIQGNGFFPVADSGRLFYTRDGSFDTDKNGDLVHRGTGARLLGWKADENGVIDTTKTIDPTSKINVQVGSQKAVQMTNRATITGNLNSGAVSTDKVTTSIRVWDSLGQPKDLTVVMSNHQVPVTGGPAGATSSWDWQAFDGPTTGTPVGSSTDTGNSKLFFDANGKPVANLPAGTFNKISMPGGTGAANPFPIDLDFGSVNSLSSSSNASFSTQNGFEPG
ncbi:MAG: flagellar hook-basal body complex protein, partial [Rhodococcus sp. (in: high G+C Gram-positive bacteria)]